MVSLTLTPLAPWQAAQTVATLALPASMSGAAAASGAASRTAAESASCFFMVDSLPGGWLAGEQSRGNCIPISLTSTPLGWIRDNGPHGKTTPRPLRPHHRPAGAGRQRVRMDCRRGDLLRDPRPLLRPGLRPGRHRQHLLDL